MRKLYKKSTINSLRMRSAKSMNKSEVNLSNQLSKASFRSWKQSSPRPEISKLSGKLSSKALYGKTMTKSMSCSSDRLLKKKFLTSKKSLKLPASPLKIIGQKSLELSTQQIDELRDYNQIYYLGCPSTKYADHFAYRYEILGSLGHGSFGDVYKVLDHKHKRELALKVIKKGKKMQKQAQIEIKILKLLRGKSKYIVNVKSYFTFRGLLCITFELLQRNLFDVINMNSKLPLSVIRKYGKQMLIGLSTIHKHKVIHCDLKPENILLSDEIIKIIDFGSSCFKGKTVYNYIQSRFYRAPEVLLGIDYNTKIDIWSIGCIFAELFIGAALFKGGDEFDQMGCIVEVLGNPPKSLLKIGNRKKVFFNNENSSKNNRYLPASLPLSAVLRGASEEFLDLVTSCLRWDPAKRITATAALQLPFFKKLKKF